MNNNRLYYKNEMKDFKMAIFFFLSMLVVSAIGHFLEAPDAPYIFTFGIVVFFSLIMFLINLKYYLTYQKNQKIKMYGQRIDGYINSFECGVTRRGRGKNRVYYRLVVTYIHPSSNQHCIYVTPKVNFDIFKSLSSRRCNVYLLNNKVYASDFVLRSENQECVWESEIVQQYNSQELLNQDIYQWLKIMLVAFMLLFLLFIFG